MKILVAPNSMKGSLNAFDFADTVEKALLNFSADFKVRKVPVADGGDFTGEVLAKAMNARSQKVEVHNPAGKKSYAEYYIAGKTAIIEMANASGMKLLDGIDLDPLKNSSIGTGELLADAVSKGCTEIWLAIGGSATVDGGMGMMEALGFSFYDKKGDRLTGNGANTKRINEISVPAEMPEISVKIICDVDNPLLGEKGAATVFGPQKGATSEMVIELEKGLKNWSEVIKEQTGKDVSNLSGTGAAGGISVPLLAFFNAKIVQGADFVLSVLNFEEHLKWADMVITGEGKIDLQTLNNKAPFAVARWAKNQDKPVYAFAGLVENGAEEIFDGVFSISEEADDIESAMKNAGSLLFDKVTNFAQWLVKKK